MSTQSCKEAFGKELLPRYSQPYTPHNHQVSRGNSHDSLQVFWHALKLIVPTPSLTPPELRNPVYAKQCFKQPREHQKQLHLVVYKYIYIGKQICFSIDLPVILSDLNRAAPSNPSSAERAAEMVPATLGWPEKLPSP